MFAYLDVAAFLLSTLKDYKWLDNLPVSEDFLLGFSFYIFGIAMIGLPVVFALGFCFSIIAVSDAGSKHKVVDGRYFTRCLIYRIASVLCVFLFFYAFTKMSQNGNPEHGGDVFMVGFPGSIGLMLALSGTTSLHVISGLSVCMKQKEITRGQFALHIFLQLCCGLDFISSLALTDREWRAHPDERVGFFQHVFNRNRSRYRFFRCVFECNNILLSPNSPYLLTSSFCGPGCGYCVVSINDI